MVEIKLKIEGLEEILKGIDKEKIENFLDWIKIPRFAVETLPCKGPRYEYKKVNALVIVDRENKYSTEVRCVRYETGYCNKSKTEPIKGEQKSEPLLECIYRPHKNKGNDREE